MFTSIVSYRILDLHATMTSRIQAQVAVAVTHQHLPCQHKDVRVCVGGGSFCSGNREVETLGDAGLLLASEGLRGMELVDLGIRSRQQVCLSPRSP